jgi:glycosyltransferase involved in cell wall biosynthesis
MYDYKGVPTVIAAAALLPACDFVMVGGLPADIAAQRARAEAAGLTNVAFTGMKPYAALPALLWDADVLLLPPSANHASAQWTSPVKLGEYLVSGTPVVASAIPALTRLLTDREAVLFRPDDAHDLARAIRAVFGDPAGAAARSAAARVLADRWSYAARAGAILGHALGQAG